jgi:hypothetical protein
LASLLVAPGPAAISPAVVHIRHMTPPPIVVHVVSTSITNSIAARSKKVVSTGSRPAPVQTPVSCVVAIHKHAALPVLIPTAIIEPSVAKYVSLPALSVSSAAALRESRCRCDAEYQSAKCDSQKIGSHRRLLLGRVGRVPVLILCKLQIEPGCAGNAAGIRDRCNCKWG